MIYLLDVNVLLALGYEEHIHHSRAEEWLDKLRSAGLLATLASCAITELGFVRVAGQAGFAENIGVAQKDLERLKTKKFFTFIAPTSWALIACPDGLPRPSTLLTGICLRWQQPIPRRS